MVFGFYGSDICVFIKILKIVQVFKTFAVFVILYFSMMIEKPLWSHEANIKVLHSLKQTVKCENDF